MFNIVGYNFLQDINALDPRPTSIQNITKTQIQNGIFDHINITRDITSAYSSSIPVWDFLTILDCNFNGNIEGGNIGFALETLTDILVKRRIVGDFDWITLFDVPILAIEDLSFTKLDYFAKTGEKYEYAIVPVFNKTEGNYVTSTVDSKFSGTFICDTSSIYKFYAGVQFGSGEQINRTQVFEPLASQSPVVISNGAINYFKSSLTGSVFSPLEMTDRELHALDNVAYKNKLINFLTKKRAKIIKDWNGNIYLVLIVDNIGISPNNSVGGRYNDISFNYVEVGNPNSQKDLVRTGLVPNLEVVL
ncbi:MAG: hypothetical protein RR313_03630 [Anaerovoracaceae bacterium]